MELLANPIHTVIFITSGIAIVLSLVVVFFDGHRWGYVIGPLTYFVNVFLYNLALHLKYVMGIDTISLQFLEYWSAVVRLHGLFLFMGLVIVQPLMKRRERNGY